MIKRQYVSYHKGSLGILIKFGKLGFYFEITFKCYGETVFRILALIIL